MQAAVKAFITTGLFFMLLPGTFLGVWNLISISSRRALEQLSPAWVQAHGHAQVFGWLGTFVLGIGFHSLSKMGTLSPQSVRRAWLCYGLWTSGVTLRWIANVMAFEWRVAMPLSAFLELAGFLVFLGTVSGHKSDPDTPPKPMEPWMKLVVGGSFGFLLALVLNVAGTLDASIRAAGPAIRHAIDQRMLFVPAWAFLVPSVWGFNARWLPAFIGLRSADGTKLQVALGAAFAGVIAAVLGYSVVAAGFLLAALLAAIKGLHIFEARLLPSQTSAVHSSFPVFIKAAYVWLVVAGCLTAWAAVADHAGGIWGASRHALTVGFLAAMVFAIGQRILPALCGARALFSKRMMFGSLLLLNLGCALRVGAEIPAYEGFAQQAWRILPVSAITELLAVALFATNLLFTFARSRAQERIS